LCDGSDVAIKVIRHSLSSLDIKTQKSVFREIKVWARLEHINVLPLLGYSLEWSAFPALVSPWQPNGTANDYVRDKPQTVVLHVVSGTVSGLEYLHQSGIIHGDFRGNNILISRDGNSIVADFGLSTTAIYTFGMTASSSTPSGNPRWMSPELLNEDTGTHTVESDVWSCGMTILELISLEPPYRTIRLNAKVSLAVMQGQKPEFPDNMNIQLRKLCALCWSMDPEDRPNMQSASLDWN